jgi:hypothetical protein
MLLTIKAEEYMKRKKCAECQTFIAFNVWAVRTHDV